MSRAIYPTVGRVVHYYPTEHEVSVEPLAAIIAHVWSGQHVNLMVIDADGVPHSRTSVYLDQPDCPTKPPRPYCTWMPYQLGQAEKTREAEAATIQKGEGE